MKPNLIQPLQLAVVSIANIGSNLLFQWLLITKLGPGAESDALFAAMTVPQLFTAIVSSSLTQVLVPLFAGETIEKQRQDSWTILFYGVVIFITITISLILSAKFWVPLTVPGFNDANKTITIELAKISLISMAFTGVMSVQTALGYANGRFIWADSAAGISNIVSSISLIYFLPLYGAVAAAILAVVKLMLQSLLLIPLMTRPKLPEFSGNFKNKAWDRLKPILVGASYYKMDPLVDRILLSSATNGSLSLLYLSQQLHSAASQVVVKVLASPAITKLSILFKLEDMISFKKLASKKLLLIAIVCTVGVVIFAAVGHYAIEFFMLGPNFSINNTDYLWSLVLISSGMFVAGSLGGLTAGIFYATGDTKTPTWLGAIAFTAGIAIKVIMFKNFGAIGLAFAISIYYFISLSMHLQVLITKELLQPINIDLIRKYRGVK